MNIRLGSDLRAHGTPGNGVPRLFIYWKPDGPPHRVKEEWVRADTFDDRFDLSKIDRVDAKWILQLRQVVRESQEEQEPLLVTIIDQRLQAGDDVHADFDVTGADGNVYHHAGKLRGIAQLTMKSLKMKKMADGDQGVSITYEKDNPTPSYKGHTEVVLSVETFDHRYTLKPIANGAYSTNKHWMLTNV